MSSRTRSHGGLPGESAKSTPHDTGLAAIWINEPGRSRIAPSWPAAQFLGSSRRAPDHEPGLPLPSLARTRHHIRVVGRVLLVNCDAVTVWSTVNGAANESVLSTWMVYVAAPLTSLQSKVIV